MIKQPLVYIIILNWNGYQDTVECLDSLEDLKYQNYKIVVVDNGSKNKEAQRLSKKYPHVKIIKNKKNLGFAKGNNQGIRLALEKKAKYILLLNNDTTIKADFLKQLVNFAEINKFQGILSPKILYYHSDKIWSMGGRLSVLTSIPRMIGQGKPSGRFNKTVEPNFATGCAFFVNSEVIKKVGLLNPRYFAYYEDTDLSYRIRKAGYKIKVIPKSIIWHKVSQSMPGKNLKKIGEIQSFLLAKNGLIFGNLNLEGFSKFIYLINQLTTKFILYLIFKCDSNKARVAYTRGLIEGSRFLLQLHQGEYPKVLPLGMSRRFRRSRD